VLPREVKTENIINMSVKENIRIDRLEIMEKAREISDEFY